MTGGGGQGGDPAVRVSDLTLSFGSRRALENVNLTVRSGEFLALVGENGAGKSTLVGCLSGVLTPDRGRILVHGRDPATAFRKRDLTVVWQDGALCDNLSVTANLFLGSEIGRVFLSRRAMKRQVLGVLARVGLGPQHLRRRIGDLSGGERQAVAIARALMVRPRVLVLDEPTSALGVQETHRVDRLLRDLHEEGLAIILVSHRVEQVYRLADRVLALRHGRVVGDLSTLECHVDDVVALASGLEVDSVARRHLAQLSGLVDQLAEVEPSASLPVIVAAMSTAMGNQKLCVHLVNPDTPGELVLRAWVGAQEPELAALRTVPIGRPGGSIGEAAASRLPVVADDLGRGAATGPVATGMWSVPVQAAGEVFGVLSGLAEVPGRAQRDQIRLASVYANLAATAIEREGLLDDVTRRNRVLESLRGVLAALAGPGTLSTSMATALDTLTRGLGAQATALVERTGPGRIVTQAASTAGPGNDARTALQVLHQACGRLAPGEGHDAHGESHDAHGEGRRAPGEGPGAHDEGQPAPGEGHAAPGEGHAAPGEGHAAPGEGHAAPGEGHAAPGEGHAAPGEGPDAPGENGAGRPAGGHPAGGHPIDLLPFHVGGRDFVLAVAWTGPGPRGTDTEELLTNAVRSLRLAVQRDLAQEARAEAELLRRIRDLQNDFIRRLSHELRTPLTAITGYATTLRATDVTWDTESQWRFLDAIVSVSQRMTRLVEDLLDTAAISSGNMTLREDWCDMGAVLGAAVDAIPDRGQTITIRAQRLAPLWGDHDRLEQVLVNLLDNAVTHGGPHITVGALMEGDRMIIEVADDGPGIPEPLRDSAFLAYVRGDTTQPGAGLGLAICKAIVEAHQGDLRILAVKGGAKVRVSLPLRGEPETPR